jgi:catechol 2,3-dioxygenase-like lactoylglutathione lyase family enzyme
MKPLGINRTNTILYCERWEATVRFYRDMINLPVLTEKGWFVEFQLTQNACLSVAASEHASIASAGGAGVTLSWRVEDVDAVRDRLIADGIGVTPVRTIWGAKSCFIFDPEGNRIELWA